MLDRTRMLFIAGRIFKPIFYEQTVFVSEERCIALIIFEGVGS